jgi:hypothetical protein
MQGRNCRHGCLFHCISEGDGSGVAVVDGDVDVCNAGRSVIRLGGVSFRIFYGFRRIRICISGYRDVLRPEKVGVAKEDIVPDTLAARCRFDHGRDTLANTVVNVTHAPWQPIFSRMT